jgi:CheY-like chemotaxis protein
MSTIAKKKILLIEDEGHKREELSIYITEFVRLENTLETVDSVRSAVVAVTAQDYDLIVLDMALPTFTTDENVIDGGHDQALGGIEVLRTLKSLGKCTKVIIVTQYPDISLNGKRIKLRSAEVLLSKKYNQDILGSVLYKYKSTTNRTKIQGIVRKIW